MIVSRAHIFFPKNQGSSHNSPILGVSSFAAGPQFRPTRAVARCSFSTYGDKCQAQDKRSDRASVSQGCGNAAGRQAAQGGQRHAQGCGQGSWERPWGWCLREGPELADRQAGTPGGAARAHGGPCFPSDSSPEATEVASCLASAGRCPARWCPPAPEPTSDHPAGAGPSICISNKCLGDTWWETTP